MKKYLVCLIVCFIVGTSVLASSYLYNANEVSYTADSSLNWNVHNVDEAIGDLYSKASSPSSSIKEFTTFARTNEYNDYQTHYYTQVTDCKNIPNYDKLSSNDFIVAVYQDSVNSATKSEYADAGVGDITWTYNATTGQLTTRFYMFVGSAFRIGYYTVRFKIWYLDK